MTSAPGLSANPGLLAALAQQYVGPAAIPQIQRSQYLSDALNAIQQSGSQNLRSPLALGSNLLAEAITRYAQDRNNAKLLKEVQSGQQALMTGGPQIPGLDGAAPAAATPTAAPTAMPATAAPQDIASLLTPPPSGPAVMGSPVGDSLSDPQGRAYQRALADGLTPGGAAGLVGNFTAESGPNLDRDNPAEGAIGAANWRGSRAQALQAYEAAHGGPSLENQVDFAVNELKGQPRLLEALNSSTDPQSAALAGAGFERPAGWKPGITDGSGIAGWGNRVAGAQKLWGQGQQSTATSTQPPPAPNPAMLSTGADPSVPTPQPGPYQVASNGPTPAPPQGIPQASVGGPRPFTPEQIDYYRQLQQAALQHPQIYGGAFMALRQKMAEQAMTPMDVTTSRPTESGDVVQSDATGASRVVHPQGLTFGAKPMMVWGADGQPHMVAGTGFNVVNAGPGGGYQQGPDGKVEAFTNPNAGPLPAGTVASTTPGGGSQITPIPGSQPRPLTDPKERAAAGILPSDRNAYAMGPDGKVVKVADNPYGPTQIQSVHDNFWGSDETKKYQEAYSAFTGLSNALASATKNNGPLDQAAIDSFLRGINPGMGARNSTVQMVMSHFGFPQELQGKISSLLGNGFVTPQSLQQMIQITHDYAQAHGSAAQARSASDAKMVAPYGYGAPDLAEDLPSLGAVPTVRFGVGSPNGSGANTQRPDVPGSRPGMGGAAPDRAALEAEARRRGLIR